MSAHYKVAWLCEALLVSRSGYYDWKKRRRAPGPREVENTRLRQCIRKEFARSRQTYGSPRLARALGCPGKRNRIARLMRLERLFARQRSKYRVATTDSRHGGPIAPNRLRGLAVQRLDQVSRHRCHVRADRSRLVVSGRSPGFVLPSRYRLGHESAAGCSTSYRRSAHGLESTSAHQITHHPLRSGQPVCQRRLPSPSHSTRPRSVHGSQGQLLRQCFH
jgi:HTH-like domain